MSESKSLKKVGGFSLNTATLDEVMALAEIVAKSTIVPRDYQNNPGNVLIAYLWGREINLELLQSMQAICVINGRPSVYGDAMLAMVRGSGLMADITETIDEDSKTATCTITRKGETPATRTFSMEDAQRANLANKDGPWKQYPKRMLQMRARSWALRDVFPDVLRGVHIAEEARDIPAEKYMGQVEVAEPAQKQQPEMIVGPGAAEPAPTAPEQSVADDYMDADEPDSEALTDIIEAFGEAENKDELDAVAVSAAKLRTATEKSKARGVYTDALIRLKAAAKAKREAAKQPEQRQHIDTQKTVAKGCQKVGRPQPEDEWLADYNKADAKPEQGAIE